MPRALSRLAQPRRSARPRRARAGLAAAVDMAALLTARSCRSFSPTPVPRSRRCRAPCAAISRPRWTTSCRCSSAAASSARAMMANWTRCARWRPDPAGDRRDGARPRRGDGHPLAQIRHNVLGFYIEVTANNAGAMTGTDEARPLHPSPVASAMPSPPPNWPGWRPGSPTPPAARWRSSSPSSTAAGRAVEAADAIRAGAAALAEIDLAAALAVLAAEQDCCRPRVDASLTFRIEAGRHPVVEQALRRQLADPFVANDCDLSPAGGAASGRSGCSPANMGGKSTFLRQNALIAVMAGGLLRAALRRDRRGRPAVQQGRRSDDLARSRSTFMVEMVETAAILNQAGERSRSSSANRPRHMHLTACRRWAAVEFKKNRARAIFATHFRDDGARREAAAAAQRHHARQGWEGDVVFLHEVAAGAADRSTAWGRPRRPAGAGGRARPPGAASSRGELSGRASRLQSAACRCSPSRGEERGGAATNAATS